MAVFERGAVTGHAEDRRPRSARVEGDRRMGLRCPYCSGEMKPYTATPFHQGGQAKLIRWVRCVGCQHVSIEQVQTLDVMPDHPIVIGSSILPARTELELAQVS